MTRLVLAGFGDLNSRVGQRWQKTHGDAIAMRRSRADPESTIKQVQIDLSTEIWPDLQADCLLVALSAKTRSLVGYQQAYVDPIKQLRHSMQHWQKMPGKIIVVSSSRVFAQTEGEVFTDVSEANSTDPYAKILIAMEKELHTIQTSTCAATLSGIYSVDRDWFKRLARKPDQELPKSNHWTNRIHVDDAAAALIHLLELDAIPERVIVSDTKPMPFFEVIRYLREQENLPVLLDEPEVKGGKRLTPSFLQNSGFQWQFPTALSGGYDQ